MALELAWSCSGSVSGEMVNVINPRATTSGDFVNGPAWNLWWFKERLKEVGWTVVSSSNSQTTSSSDLWGSSFNDTIRSSKNTNVFYGYAGNAHSWIVLSAPSGSNAAGNYLILDYASSDASAVKAQFVIAKGAIGGGSTTTRPSGSAEFGINSTNGASATEIVIFDDYTNSTAQHRVNFHYSSEGAFIFTEAQVGKGKFTHFISFLPLQNTHAVDNYKWVMVGLDNYLNAAGWGQFYTIGGTTASPLWIEGSGAITGRAHDGATLLELAGAVLAVAPEGGSLSSSTILFSGLLTAPNASDATYSDFPITIVNTSGGPIEFKGRLPDITWTSTAIPNGAVSPPKANANSAYERVKHIMMWLPWTSTSAPVL